MTLPLSITLPLMLQEEATKDPNQVYVYLRKLAYVLSVSLQQTNQTLNGVDLYFTNILNPTWNFIQGSTLSGVTTYTASSLLVRVINLLVFVSFDISWSATTGTGDILIALPYFARNSIGTPFIGVIEPDSMAFTAGYTYLTGNIAPTTNTIQVNQNGSGLPTLALPITGSGHLKGSMVYAISR